MNGTSLRRLAIALSTAAVAVSIAIDDGRAAKIRKNTVKAELPPGQLTEGDYVGKCRSARRPAKWTS